MLEMAKLTVPVIAIVIGEGSSGGALAISIADHIIMLENSVYSILSPEGFASILYKDASKNKEAAEKMKITAKDLKKLGVVDTVILEPEGGAQNNVDLVSQKIKKEIQSALKVLKKKEKSQLLEERYQKYRKIGSKEQLKVADCTHIPTK